MENILLVGFFKEEEIRKGEVYWNGKYFEAIKSFHGAGELTCADSKDAVAYLVGKDNAEEKCIQLFIQDIYTNDKYMKVKYIAGDELKYNSGFAATALRYLISKERLTGPYPPLCVKVDKDLFEKLTDDETLIHKINILKRKNDWIGIYNLTGSAESIKTKEILWSNEQILNGLSFAAAKLSETYINLKWSFKTDEERNKFLAQQKKYREETVTLRKRCIELNPGNAAYYSNLGYSYYQFTRELMMPGGRRDGRIKEEAMKALEYMDKALAIDPQRVTDLYRKGQILASVMPAQILFGGKSTPGEDQVKESRKSLSDGIECFKRVEEVWQILPVLEDKMTKRYKKEYIKSLYDAARAYEELAGDEWDITQYLLPFKYENDDRNPGKYKEEKLKSLDNSIAYMEKCAHADNENFREKFPPPPVITLCRFNGVADGTHKLYSMGKYFFQKYLILTGCDEGYYQEAAYYRDTAEEYFIAALRFKPKPENEKQSKGYIAEKLARVYISKGKYNEAADLLKKYISQSTPYYMRYTYAAACCLSGRLSESANQAELAMKNERRNFEMWLGEFLIYVKYLKEDNTEEAGAHLKKSEGMMKKTGKRSQASLLTGQAHISYRSGNRKEAIGLLIKAAELNPERKGIRKKIKEWEENPGA